MTLRSEDLGGVLSCVNAFPSISACLEVLCVFAFFSSFCRSIIVILLLSSFDSSHRGACYSFA